MWITSLPAVSTIPPVKPIQYSSPLANIPNATIMIDKCIPAPSTVLYKLPARDNISSTENPDDKYTGNELPFILYIGFFAPIMFIVCVASVYNRNKRSSTNRARANSALQVRMNELEEQIEEFD